MKKKMRDIFDVFADPALHPILFDHVRTGIIAWKDGAFIGIASDGTEAQVGHDAHSAERYLRHHPNPSDW